jgi:hypothetical protein
MNKTKSVFYGHGDEPFPPYANENHKGHFKNMDKESLIGIIEKLIEMHYKLEGKIKPPDKDEIRIMSEIYRDGNKFIGNRLGYRVFYRG